MPKVYQALATKVFLFHQYVQNALTLEAEVILNLFNQLDVWRKPEEFEDFLITCEAEYLSSLVVKDRSAIEIPTFQQKIFLQHVLTNTAAVTARQFIAQGVKGAEIKTAIYQERLIVINQLITQYQQ